MHHAHNLSANLGHFNLSRAVREVLTLRKDHVVAVYLDRGERVERELTGGVLLDESLRAAAMLSQRFSPGSAALIVMPPGADFLITLLACIHAGVVAIPLPVPRTGSRGERLDGVISDSRAAAILCTTGSIANLEEHRSHRDAGCTWPPMLVMDDADATRDSQVRESVTAGLEFDPDAPVIVQYSSGSTRAPRGIPISGRNVLCNAALVAESWARGPDTVGVNWLPHFHDMGLMGGILYPLLRGARSIQMSPLAFVQKPVRWLRAISEYRGTFSGAPAFAFALCLATVRDTTGLDLSSWFGAFCGGEPVPATLLQAFRDRFASAGLDPVAVGAAYGLAEATVHVAGERPREHSAAPGVYRSVLAPCHLSRPMRDSLRIVDPHTGRVLPDGQEGEIWVSGPSIARVELERPANGVEDALYLRTGDLGVLDGDALYITGRIKDILIVAGANVAAIDIEWLAAEQHPALNPLAAAAVVLDTQSSNRGALLIEVVTPDATIEDAPGVAERIRASVSAAYGVELETIRFLQPRTLDRTTSGKVRRQLVASRLRNGHRYAEIEPTAAQPVSES